MAYKIAAIIIPVLLVIGVCGSLYMQIIPLLQNPQLEDSEESTAPPPLPVKFTPLSKRTVDTVEKFVYFTGWPRSGHMIISRILDAHPDVVIGNMSVFNRIQWSVLGTDKASIFNWLYEDSYKGALLPNYYRTKLTVSGLWQGRFKDLKVIGDARIPTKTYLNARFPSDFLQYCKQLEDVIKIPLRVICVVRNPYDMIATGVIYEAERRATGRYGVKLSSTDQYENAHLLKRMTKLTFSRAEAVTEINKLCNMTVLEIHHADHIKYPFATLQKICDFLELECSTNYLDKCSSETSNELSRTRDSVVWTPEVIAMVEEEKYKYPFFQRYTFDKDY